MESEHVTPAVPDRSADAARLRGGLVLIVAFMLVEVVVGITAHSLALLSDAAHMLTDAVALGVSLVAARLAMRPAGGVMTFGLGRAEILSAQANALTMLVLAALILYGAIDHLVHPLAVHGWPVLIVALVGIVVNLVVVRVLGGPQPWPRRPRPRPQPRPRPRPRRWGRSCGPGPRRA